MGRLQRGFLGVSKLRYALAVLSMALATPAMAQATFVVQLPSTVCEPSAPAYACQSTMPLDLTGVTKMRVSVQGLNFAIGVPPAPAVIRLRNINDIAAPCFGATCPTMTIPFSSPALGPCCSPVTTVTMSVPVAQRRANVRLRLDIGGGNFFFGNAQPPMVQFWK